MLNYVIYGEEAEEKEMGTDASYGIFCERRRGVKFFFESSEPVC